MTFELPDRILGSLLMLATDELERARHQIARLESIRGNTHNQVLALADENVQLIEERNTLRLERDRAQAAADGWEQHARETQDILSVYQGEIELIIEAVGAEGMADIREKIAALQEHDQKNNHAMEQIDSYRKEAHANMELAQASNAALAQAAWLMLRAPITPEHRAHASTTYWGRRAILEQLIEGMQEGAEYPGRQFLLALEQASERAENAERALGRYTQQPHPAQEEQTA